MKTILYILFICLPYTFFAQNYIIKIAGMPPGNVDYISAKAAQFLSVEGPENPQIVRFRITHSSSTLDYTAISYSSKFTKEQKEILYNMYRDNKMYVDKIRIKTDSRIIDLASVTFKLSTYDALNLATVCGKQGGILTKAEILNDPYIRLNTDEGTIIGFSLSYLQPADTEHATKGNKLTEPMINAIKNCKSGWVFWISNIKIQQEDNKIIIANPIDFRVK